MQATTQRIELAKQVDAILEDQDLDFDQACSAVVGLIQDTTAGAPLPPGPVQYLDTIEKKVVPVESLAPACLESPSGKHCGDHRYRVTENLHELRCCWCKATQEVRIRKIHVITEGHGPKSGYDEDRFEMPVGWEEGA